MLNKTLSILVFVVIWTPYQREGPLKEKMMVGGIKDVSLSQD